MRALTPEEIQKLLSSGTSRSLGRRDDSRNTSAGVAVPHRASVPECNHDFQPNKIIVSGTGKEYPTKRCSLCELWLLLQPNEVAIEPIADMGAWLG